MAWYDHLHSETILVQVDSMVLVELVVLIPARESAAARKIDPDRLVGWLAEVEESAVDMWNASVYGRRERRRDLEDSKKRRGRDWS